MDFKSLKDTDLTTLTLTFNEAFSDYAVPMHFTVEQFAEKSLRDGTNLEYSVGAFDGETLVGFILLSLGTWNGKNTAYNGGTGVVPAYRGRKITQLLYQFCLPELKKAGVEQCTLEVLKSNRPAVKTYQNIGFIVNRSLESFKGELKNQPLDLSLEKEGIALKEVTSLDWEKTQSFWDYGPSWQYDIPAIHRILNKSKIVGIFSNDNLIGYGIFNINTNRVAQFAIEETYRRQGLGRLLFWYLANNSSDSLSVINVDSRIEGTLNFLQKIGLYPHISQYEMILPLT